MDMLFDGELEHGRGTCISDSSHTTTTSFRIAPHTPRRNITRNDRQAGRRRVGT
jgi:hypothetical protein